MQVVVVEEEIDQDMISNLPVAIIHDHIFPFLPNKDIKVTTCLSKSWYHISNSFPPELDFDDYAFDWEWYRHANDIKYKYERYMVGFSGKEKEEKYMNYVTQTLHRFHHHSIGTGRRAIRKFSIPLIYSPWVFLAPLLDTWIALVLQHGHGVDDFNISFSNSTRSHPYYDLPHPIFHANSIIKRASFTSCSFLRSFPTYPNPNPNLHLRKLSLDKVLLDETTLCCIISTTCPLIEELSITNCMEKLNCLRISNFHKLKTLIICDDQFEIVFIEINSPSLQSLDIKGSINYNNVKIRIIGSCPILTGLQLKHLREFDSQDILSRLPLLQTLCLVSIRTLTELKVSSDTLEKLTIVGCDHLVQMNIIDAPNLLSVTYKDSSIPLLVHSSNHTPRWYVSAGYYGAANQIRMVEDFIVDLVKFVSNIKLVDLHISKIWEIINLLELKQRVVHPPIAHIDNLKLSIERDSGYNNFILDAVLWSCRPRTFSIELTNGNTGYVFHICKIIMLHHRGDCCFASCTLDTSYWLHRIEEVMHVKEDGTENRLLMDGTSLPSSLRWYNRDQIKFIFKW